MPLAGFPPAGVAPQSWLLAPDATDIDLLFVVMDTWQSPKTMNYEVHAAITFDNARDHTVGVRYVWLKLSVGADIGTAVAVSGNLHAIALAEVGIEYCIIPVVWAGEVPEDHYLFLTARASIAHIVRVRPDAPDSKWLVKEHYGGVS